MARFSALVGIASLGVALSFVRGGHTAPLQAKELALPSPTAPWIAPSATGTTPRIRVEVNDPVEAVVLVVIDGTRWQDVFGAVQEDPEIGAIDPKLRLPHIANLTKTGALLGGNEATVSALNPDFVSLPGYAEIFTGTTTKCVSNWCAGTDKQTLVDRLAAQGVGSSELAIISSWAPIGRVAAKGKSVATMSVGRTVRTHPENFEADAELASLVKRAQNTGAWPGEADYRTDQYTAQIALRYLHVHHPRFLFVGLGDTDEHAHHGNKSRYVSALKAADDTVGAIVDLLANEGSYGKRTMVIVTADHGRAKSFNNHTGAKEAARVFVASGGGGHFVTTSKALTLTDIAPAVLDALGTRTPLANAQRD